MRQYELQTNKQMNVCEKSGAHIGGMQIHRHNCLHAWIAALVAANTFGIFQHRKKIGNKIKVQKKCLPKV